MEREKKLLKCNNAECFFKLLFILGKEDGGGLSYLLTLQQHLNVNRKLPLNDYRIHFSALNIF